VCGPLSLLRSLFALTERGTYKSRRDLGMVGYFSFSHDGKIGRRWKIDIEWLFVRVSYCAFSFL